MPFEIRLAGKTLAAAAVLGAGAVLALASMATRGGAGAPVATEAIVDAMVTQKDHVGATELARWIIEKRTDYQLIDIRQPWEFDDYHIPTAVNVPLPELFQSANLAKLERTKKIVVYGLGAGHSAEAQLLLQLKGYPSLSLKEGITAWWDEVMTPTSLKGSEPRPEGYQQARQLRDMFMGSTGGGAKTSGAAPPPLPAAPSPNGAPPRKLKLGRGCS
jgi:rhodanese-related sulfurtransferase